MYIILLLVLILAYYLTKNAKTKTKNIVLTVLIILIILIQGLRHFNIGVDVKSYMFYFNSFRNESFSNSIKNYEMEKLYIVLNKLVQFLDCDFRTLLFLISCSIFIPIYIITKRESKSPIMSIFLFITLGLFLFSLSGLRQTIAIGLTFFSFRFVKDKKPIWFILTIIIAMNFHTSALVFLIAYPAYHLKIKKYIIPLIIIGILGIYIFRKPIFDSLYTLYKDTHIPTETNAYGFLLLLLAIWIFSMFWSYKKSDTHINGLMNLILVAIIIQLFVSYSTLVMRFGYYFYIYLILLIPEIIHSIKDKPLKIAAEVVVFLVLGIYFLVGLEGNIMKIYPYRFLWDDYIKIIGVKYL